MGVIFGCNAQTVRNYIRRYNIDWRKQPPPGKERIVQMPGLQKLVEKGWRLPKLAKYYGCCAQTVLNRIHAEDLSYNWNRGSPGAANGSWKGGISKKRKLDGGYWIVPCPSHPYARKDGFVLESRLVMEKKIGRYLFPSEVVHHKDDNTQNNDPNNLVLYKTNGEHLAETLRGRIPHWTEDGKRRIAEGVRKPRGSYRKSSRGKLGKRGVL